MKKGTIIVNKKSRKEWEITFINNNSIGIMALQSFMPKTILISKEQLNKLWEEK